jgi:hypothetical protein
MSKFGEMMARFDSSSKLEERLETDFLIPAENQEVININVDIKLESTQHSKPSNEYIS